LEERLIVKKGPPIDDLAKYTELLTLMANYYGADVVYLDSLKDAVVGLSDDAVAAAYNRARQHLTAQGIELCELHHTRKPASGADPAKALADVFGSIWITAGTGSVIQLIGEPGDPVLGLYHTRPVVEPVGPLQLIHDSDSGVLSVDSERDLLGMLKAGMADGLTALDGAKYLYDTDRPSRAQIERVRRKLDQFVEDGTATYTPGIRGRGGPPSTWWAV
jgi:hypothetical protein